MAEARFVGPGVLLFVTIQEVVEGVLTELIQFVTIGIRSWSCRAGCARSDGVIVGSLPEVAKKF
eukprot:1513048-Pyramimonas_sp.AAC.1